MSDSDDVDTPMSFTSPDGSVHKKWRDGRAHSTYANGCTMKLDAQGVRTSAYPSGDIITVRPDGSKMQQCADGTVIEVDVNGKRTQVASSGEVATYDSTGKMESGSAVTRKADGTTTQRSQDGTIQTTLPNGTVITKAPDGTKTTSRPDGFELVVMSDGTRLQRNPDGSETSQSADGTRWQRTADGAEVTIAPDGTQEQLMADGTQIMVKPNGTTVQVDANGMTHTHVPGKAVTSAQGAPPPSSIRPRAVASFAERTSRFGAANAGEDSTASHVSSSLATTFGVKRTHRSASTLSASPSISPINGSTDTDSDGSAAASLTVTAARARLHDQKQRRGGGRRRAAAKKIERPQTYGAGGKNATRNRRAAKATPEASSSLLSSTLSHMQKKKKKKSKRGVGRRSSVGSLELKHTASSRDDDNDADSRGPPLTAHANSEISAQLSELEDLRAVLSTSEFEAAKRRIHELYNASADDGVPHELDGGAMTRTKKKKKKKTKTRPDLLSSLLRKEEEKAAQKSSRKMKKKSKRLKHEVEEAKHEVEELHKAVQHDTDEHKRIEGELAAKEAELAKSHRSARKMQLLGKIRSAGAKQLLRKQHSLTEAVHAKQLEVQQRKARIVSLKGAMRSAGQKALLKKKMVEVQSVLKDHARQSIKAEEAKIRHERQLAITTLKAQEQQMAQIARHKDMLAAEEEERAMLLDQLAEAQQDAKKAKRISALKRFAFKTGTNKLVARVKHETADALKKQKSKTRMTLMAGKLRGAALKSQLKDADNRLSGVMDLIEKRFGNAAETVVEQHLREIELERELAEARESIKKMSTDARTLGPATSARSPQNVSSPTSPHFSLALPPAAWTWSAEMRRDFSEATSPSSFDWNAAAIPVSAAQAALRDSNVVTHRMAPGMPLFTANVVPRRRTERQAPTGEFANLERALELACDAVSAVALRASLDEAEECGYESGSTRLASRLLAELERSRAMRVYEPICSSSSGAVAPTLVPYASVTMTRNPVQRSARKTFGGYGVLSSVRR